MYLEGKRGEKAALFRWKHKWNWIYFVFVPVLRRQRWLMCWKTKPCNRQLWIVYETCHLPLKPWSKQKPDGSCWFFLGSNPELFVRFQMHFTAVEGFLLLLDDFSKPNVGEEQVWKCKHFPDKTQVFCCKLSGSFQAGLSYNYTGSIWTAN